VKIRSRSGICIRLTLVLRCLAVLPWVVAALAGPALAGSVEHGTGYAVVVGIDKYRFATAGELEAAKPRLIAQHMLQSGESPPARDWHPLEGAVNDMHAMRELLVHRYGFAPEHVLELPDEAATRQGILDALEKNFVERARDGDTLVFFFSGHGSQMRNSKSVTKGDKIDETIVPWDSNAGYFDIRDKELARIFNRALAAHHVTLTAIFDSCHSGSITRGLINPRAKSEPEDKRDAADAYDGGSPESHGALILSAAQYDEEALEAPDTSVSPNVMRGAFSMSLMQVIQYADPATPAVDLFRAARSRLHTLGSTYSQEPVLAGTPARLRQGLLGDALGGHLPLTVHITAIDGKAGTVTVDAGSLIGLSGGAVFKSGSGSPVEITIGEVDGLSQAQASVTSGDAQGVHVNDAYHMTTWAFPANASLSVWISPARLSKKRLNDVAHVLAPLQQLSFQWVTDPSRQTPTQVVEWTGTQWQMRGPDGVVDVTTADGMPDVARLKAHLKAADRLLVLFPVPSDWSSALQLLPGSVALASRPDSAAYWLTGTLQGKAITYAWAQPSVATADPATLTMPASTASVPLEDAGSGGTLLDYLHTLSQVASFLRLPESNSSDPFPYHLTLRRVEPAGEISGTDTQVSDNAHDDNQKTLTTARVRGGEIYDLVLKADRSTVAEGGVPDRWVYVFAVDSTGRRVPLFVYADQRARFPRNDPPIPDDPSRGRCNAQSYPQSAPLDEVCVETLRVCPAYGTDTYFVLSTDQPISDLTLFYGEGVGKAGEAVRARDALVTGVRNPLATLLQPGGGAATRSVVPENFSIERLTVLSSGAAEVPGCH
jgi:hypothetical protein